MREIDWAKAALARNPAYEILATDEIQRRLHGARHPSGTVHTLRLEDLVAAPRASKAAALPMTPAIAPAVEPTESVENPDAAAPAADALVAAQTTEEIQGTRGGSGESLAEGPGYSITRGVRGEPGDRGESRRSRIQHHAARAREAAERRERRSRGRERREAAPIPSSARAIA